MKQEVIKVGGLAVEHYIPDERRGSYAHSLLPWDGKRELDLVQFL